MKLFPLEYEEVEQKEWMDGIHIYSSLHICDSSNLLRPRGVGGGVVFTQ